MTALKDRFWAKVAFKEFIRHFRKLSPEQIVSDVMASMDALEDLDDEGDSFGSKMVRWSMERVEQYPMAQANGQKGGRPRKSFTADVELREDSQGIRTAAAITRNEPLENDPPRTSATISACAHNGNAGDDRKVPTSYNPYDQETDHRISTDEAMDLICAGVMASRPAQARPPVRSSAMNSRCPNSREEFHAFVADNNLHEALAEEWYAIHEARGFVDENGNPIKNWRGALKNYCIKTEQKRRTA